MSLSSSPQHTNTQKPIYDLEHTHCGLLQSHQSQLKLFCLLQLVLDLTFAFVKQFCSVLKSNRSHLCKSWNKHTTIKKKKKSYSFLSHEDKLPSFTLSSSQFCAQMYQIQHSPITIIGSGRHFTFRRADPFRRNHGLVAHSEGGYSRDHSPLPLTNLQ